MFAKLRALPDRWLNRVTMHRLVIGYLMMEEHGLFAELDAEEQIAVARRLKNAP